jgi:pimeloyl-ACP methyl ester carboxylesterase
LRRVAEPSLHHVDVNGVDFAYLELGAGPLALCLHGFPDSAHTWRHLLPRLADAGYRAVAPFQRGYAPTAVPADGRYQTGVLARDAIGFHEALGGDDQAVIIGHDWGAPATWGAAVHAPDRWRRVVGLAVPPGSAMGAAFVTNRTQLKRSWYMFFFQHPLADLVVAADDLAFVDMLWQDWSPGFAGGEDVARAKDALRGPANLAAALGYYRAALGAAAPDAALADVQAATSQIPTQPTLYLHGTDDGAIGIEVADFARGEAGDHVEFAIVPGTGHFLHLEQPDAVNDRIVAFLA